MQRHTAIQQIENTRQWDILIIGGGATGLGCAVDAASRGYKTLLLEKNDFAKGTSSRATKLVHGGVRYLAKGNIRLVQEALKERGRLLKNAPHVCHRLAFVVPFYNYWQKFYYRFGLWLYEFLSGKWSLGPTKFLSKKGTLRNLPNLKAEKLTGGILYFDGQFDDSRLAINLAQTATTYGATVINYFAVKDFIKQDEKIIAVRAIDTVSGRTFDIGAKVVINATGVFSDSILQLAEAHTEQTITPSQGIHLVVDKKNFEGKAGLMIPKTDDGRVLFAIPWYNKVLIGTTDTPVQQITEEPEALETEIEFILQHFNRYANTSISRKDVLSVFAGLRPLAVSKQKKSTAVMPRDHHIAILPSGLVHVTGGKWTTYRSMAEHAVNKAVKAAQLPAVKCITASLPVHGYTNATDNTHLGIYGSDAAAIQALINDNALLAEKIHPFYPYTFAEVQWMVEHEMALTAEDILARRIRLLFTDAKAAIEAAPGVAAFMATIMQQTAHWQQQQTEAFTTLAKKYLVQQML
jgi:glycerol-3-phosphate dehydrogenase